MVSRQRLTNTHNSHPKPPTFHLPQRELVLGSRPGASGHFVGSFGRTDDKRQDILPERPSQAGLQIVVKCSCRMSSSVWSLTGGGRGGKEDEYAPSSATSVGIYILYSTTRFAA